MADEVTISFKMSIEDLNFLVWTMGFMRGGPHDEKHMVDKWEAIFEEALDEHFPEIEEFAIRECGAGREGPGVRSHCPTCDKPTYHRTSGTSLKLREPDGRVSQAMECSLCGTLTKVYFTHGTDEFQENLDS